MRNTLLAFFGVVILAGESFKIAGVNLAAVALVLILLQLLLSWPHRRGERLFPYPWVMALAGAFLLVGLSRHGTADVIEDFVPFAALLIVGAGLRKLDTAELIQIYRAIVLFAAGAALKSLAINCLDVSPQWGGEEANFWQAVKLPMASGINRVILKGGDVFISLATAVVVCDAMVRCESGRMFPWRRSLLLLSALLTGLMLSLTRASMAAVALVILFWTLILSGSGALKIRRLAVVGAAILGLWISAPFAGGWLQAYYERWDFTIPLERPMEGDISLAFREFESERAIQAASESNFLGGGMGTSFFAPLNGSPKDDGRALFVHSLPAWLLLKVGVIGMVVFYAAVLKRIIAASCGVYGNHRQASMAMTALAGALFLLVNDFSNNKFATLSGAAAYALVLSVIDHFYCARQPADQRRVRLCPACPSPLIQRT